ncbi:ArsR/SmtB family transcription factor [Geoalkalibacter subterraneus]|jgi:rhodanese-related sulfurtransferase|uniref:ArsR family transcriptional regulator n=1 Tax=Geoalkalibacter subterraneus TaxID=483547 RepID=A0A0B5FNW4_9BACT|nr:metalloregulator ArsR/SmtB family transcription factor [Geoalkalibacter subterraneus]AJF05311.1 ArsR family transcriptional regulator [Geoalkalibacter subterraneus]
MSRTKQHYKEAIYAQFARIGKAVASPKRLELLDLLCQGERTVETLAREAGLSVANTSQHLQVLRGAHLAEARKQGLHVVYRIADPQVAEFFHALRTLAQTQLAEVEQLSRRFFNDRNELEAVDRHTLLDRVRTGIAAVIDVRPPEEYQAGHLPGALSIPLPELRRRLAELPRDREIVAYCRGPYCVLSAEAVEMLRAEGFQAVRMEDGVQEWQQQGLPVEKASRDPRSIDSP